MEGQRRIIEDLARLKDEFATRLDPIASAIEESVTEASAMEASAVRTSPIERTMSESYNPTQVANVSAPHGQSSELDPNFEQIPHYSHLINTLLEEVDIVQNRIDAELRVRIWNDIVHTHRREATAMIRIYGYERVQKTTSGHAWDLIRTSLEANTPATIPGITSSPDISEKRSRFLADTTMAGKVFGSSLREIPDSSAFSLPEPGQPECSPLGPRWPDLVSPSPTGDGNGDADMGSPSSYEAMSRAPEDRELAYEFEVKDADRHLPLANVARIMKKALPDNANISREAKETMQECVSELISFVTSEAVEIQTSRDRKVIKGEDVLLAFDALGFENYAEALTIYLARYRGVARDELAASLKEPKNENDKSLHSEVKEELTRTSAQAAVATGVAGKSDDDVHAKETEVTGKCHSVVDELLAQWTVL